MTTADTAWVDLTAPDGYRVRAYEARPRIEEKGRIIVVQELLGVTGHIRSVCDAYAEAGYRALAPAYFDRSVPGLELTYSSSDIARGQEIAKALPMEVSLRDTEGALTHLGGTGAAAIVGYCWGGSLAWAAAARLPVRAAIVYYGAIGDRLDQPPQAPTQLHFGEYDRAIPVAVPRAANARHRTLITHIYPAAHGFNCDERDSFHATSAALARQRTLGLLQAVF